MFTAKTGDVGDITATGRGPMVPYLYAVRPAGIPPLDEIRAKVENDARMAKAREAAKAQLTSAMSAGKRAYPSRRSIAGRKSTEACCRVKRGR